MAVMGRPTTYTKDLADLICERLSSGESMRSVSRDDEMPAMSTLFKWIRELPDFSQQYDKAKEESADALAEDMVDIADNQVSQPLIIEGKPMVVDGEVVMVKDAVSVNHAKLRIDTRKWAASKLKPKKYGDRQDLTITRAYQDMDDAELNQAIKRMEHQLEQSTED